MAQVPIASTRQVGVGNETVRWWVLQPDIDDGTYRTLSDVEFATVGWLDW